MNAIPLYKNEIFIRTYVKGYGFMSFAKSMSNKYGKKLLHTAKKSATDVVKISSKRAIQKAAVVTGDLKGNKIADKITSISKTSTKKLSKIDKDAELTTHKKIYISPEERQQLIDELRLVPRK